MRLGAPDIGGVAASGRASEALDQRFSVPGREGWETSVKSLATELAAGILLDATVIRALLVPAVVSLFGRWNWWLPAGAARLLRVRPSPEPVVGTGPS